MKANRLTGTEGYRLSPLTDIARMLDQVRKREDAGGSLRKSPAADEAHRGAGAEEAGGVTQHST